MPPSKAEMVGSKSWEVMRPVAACASSGGDYSDTTESGGEVSPSAGTSANGGSTFLPLDRAVLGVPDIWGTSSAGGGTSPVRTSAKLGGTPPSGGTSSSVMPSNALA